MEDITKSMTLASGSWEVSVYEIGNTYQVYAKNSEKIVHLMISKRDYLTNLLREQNGGTAEKSHGLTCNGKELLVESEFEAMKDLLFEHMDLDLTEDKIVWDIKPNVKPD